VLSSNIRPEIHSLFVEADHDVGQIKDGHHLKCTCQRRRLVVLSTDQHIRDRRLHSDRGGLTTELDSSNH